ncbi:hypothetical protein [Arthrobacter sp. YN]|uniref:hypothetical protein n=1 Tax=Arthrobacter sp. YN TaxID=2020486 RepID=UPI000B618662|nr:hypothetical protein [Arthrobacter sp. YN]ASN20718.1 hypothetical protein CGK93_14275 [Arthrobacter sp. YN]
MSVTTLPYMEAVPQHDSVRDDWYVLECQLCDFRTFGGAFHVCEDEASDHLDECHPRKRQMAEDERRQHYEKLMAQAQTPMVHPRDLNFNNARHYLKEGRRYVHQEDALALVRGLAEKHKDLLERLEG